MSVRIVTDSTCDLPEELIERYGIVVVPLYIHIGDRGYLDGIEISREQFYRDLPSYPAPPKTASPPPARFEQVYEQLAQEGATEILSVHISSTLSTVANEARLAARAVSSVPVIVFDSQQLTTGVGYAALKAAQCAAEGLSIPKIVAVLKEQVARTHVFAVADTFEYLRRGGRVSWLVSGIGEVLRIKPLLKMHQGKSTSEKIRTRRRALKRMVQLVEQLAPVERLDFVYTDAISAAETLWERVKHLCPEGQKPFFVQVTPVIGSHVGPGCFGLACVSHLDKGERFP